MNKLIKYSLPLMCAFVLVPSVHAIAQETCTWKIDNGISYWYENGIKQGTLNDKNGVMGDGTIRGREIYDPESNGWYWLDACFDGAKATNKEVWMPYIYQGNDNWSDEQIESTALNSKDMAKQVAKAIKDKTGKWVRYDAEGKMYKGWCKIEGDLAKVYPDQAGNTYYYDEITGLMAKGKVTIDGKEYTFNDLTGALESPTEVATQETKEETTTKVEETNNRDWYVDEDGHFVDENGVTWGVAEEDTRTDEEKYQDALEEAFGDGWEIVG